MATIAELLIKLGMDDGGLDKGMSTSQSKLKSWGESLRSVGTKLTAGVTLPLVGAGVAAVQWASDLDQAMGKSEAVFGDQAKVVQDWSKTTAESYGFAQSESLAMASTYGSLFKVMGMNNEVASEYSTRLVGLAADMSAFNDVSNERASEALMAGLTGEYMSLRSMGIFLNEATVKTEALAIAQADGREEITEADKVQARYNLILKQTAQQQGQAAREAKNFASQMQRLRAKIKDTGAAIGKILMPYALKFIETIQELLDRFGDLDPKWQKIIVAVAAFAAALGPALLALGFMLPGIAALGTAFGVLLSPLGLLIAAFAALVGIGIYAWVNDLWDIRDAVDELARAFEAFQMRFSKFLGDLEDIWQAFQARDWAEVLDETKDAIARLGNAIAGFGSDIAFSIADGLASMADQAGVLRPVLELLSTSAEYVGSALEHVQNALDALVHEDYTRAIKEIGAAMADLVLASLNWQLAIGRAIMAIAETVISESTSRALRGLAQDFRDLSTEHDDYAKTLQATAVVIEGQADAVDSYRSAWENFKAGNYKQALIDLGNGALQAHTSFQNFGGVLFHFLAETGRQFIRWVADVTGAKDAWEDLKTAFAVAWDLESSGVYQFLAGVIEKVQEAIGWLNKIPGVNIDGGGSSNNAAGDISGAYAPSGFHGMGGDQPWNDPRRYEPQRSVPQGSDRGAMVGDQLVTTLPAVGTGASTAFSQVKAAAQGITAAISAMATAVMNSLRQVTSSFQQTGSQVGSTMQQMQSRIQQGFQQIAQIAQQTSQQARQTVTQAWQQASQSTQQATSQMQSQVNSAMNQIRSIVQSAMQQVVSQAQSTMSQFVSRVQSGMQQAVSATQSGVNQIRSVVSALNLSSQGLSIGASLGQGIAAGIQSYIGTVASAAAALVTAAVTAARNAADARSPSRVMMALGGDMAEGLTIGLERGAADVAAATAGLIDVPTGNWPSSDSSGQPTIVNVFTLRSEEFLSFMQKAENGDDFARNFGSQLGLYAGMP